MASAHGSPLRVCDLFSHFFGPDCHLVSQNVVCIFVLRFLLPSFTNAVHTWRVNNVDAPREGEDFPQTLSVLMSSCHPGSLILQGASLLPRLSFVCVCGVSVSHLSLNTHQVEKAPFLKPPLPVPVLGPHRAYLTDFRFFLRKRNVIPIRLFFLEVWPYKGKEWILLSKAFKSQFNKQSGMRLSYIIWTHWAHFLNYPNIVQVCSCDMGEFVQWWQPTWPHKILFEEARLKILFEEACSKKSNKIPVKCK